MIMSGKTALAAGGLNNNFWAGQAFEFIPVLSSAEFGFLIGGTGIAVGDVEVDVICGGEAIGLNFPPNIGAAIPKYPDDFTLSGYCAAGDRLIGKVRNLDAANAADLYWTVKIDPL